jgi:NAD dependent epimerase/dehydratase family enzyme
MPWIHVTDLARLYHHAATTAPIDGPMNSVAPNPVRNSGFTRSPPLALMNAHWVGLVNVVWKTHGAPGPTAVRARGMNSGSLADAWLGGSEVT